MPALLSPDHFSASTARTRHRQPIPAGARSCINTIKPPSINMCIHVEVAHQLARRRQQNRRRDRRRTAKAHSPSTAVSQHEGGFGEVKRFQADKAWRAAKQRPGETGKRGADSKSGQRLRVGLKPNGGDRRSSSSRNASPRPAQRQHAAGG